jgi:hypothetical protein
MTEKSTLPYKFGKVDTRSTLLLLVTAKTDRLCLATELTYYNRDSEDAKGSVSV